MFEKPCNRRLAENGKSVCLSGNLIMISDITRSIALKKNGEDEDEEEEEGGR